MGSTNKTAHYELPQFVANDKPSWLGDFNQAMEAIDIGIFGAKSSADGAQTTANNAVAGVQTANTRMDGMQTQLDTVATQANQTATAVNQHTASIATNSANINTINSRLGNTDISDIGDGTVTGAIQAISEGGGGASGNVRYYNGYIQYSTDGGQTWVNWINVATPSNIIPVLTANNSSSLGVANGQSNRNPQTEAFHAFTSDGFNLQNSGDYVSFAFTGPHPATSIVVEFNSTSANTKSGDTKVEYTTDGNTWLGAGSNTISDVASESLVLPISASVTGIRVRKTTGDGLIEVKNFNVRG